MTALSRRSLIAAGVIALATPRLARAADRPIRIGVLNDPNGVYGDLGGQGCVIASRLAAEEFGGTLLGRPIEVIGGDHQNKPDLAAAIAREWIDREGVDLIADGASSACGLAIQQVVREKGRVFIISGPATSDLTNQYCAPYSFQFSYDTYSEARSLGSAITRQGGSTWYFITADYAFGYALERDTTRFVTAAGGKVLGSIRHPLGTADFSSFLLQAQSSGAKVIAFANAGTDAQNAIKQAAEFGLTGHGTQLAALVMTDTDINAVGLAIAQGLRVAAPFYWNRTEATRAWSARFMKQKPKPPTMLQAGVYSGVRHYLQAIKDTGSLDVKTVTDHMKATPVNDMNNRDVVLRADGRLMCPMYLLRVKTPTESKGSFDTYDLLATVAPEDAFRPANESQCKLLRS